VLSFLRKSELKLKVTLCFPLFVAFDVLSGGARVDCVEVLGEAGGVVDPYPESLEINEVAL
jgi:hypothetical protein